MVRTFEPARRLLLDWYPGTGPEHPTQVEITFEAADGESNHPPAKPGAFVHEPLEGAVMPHHAARPSLVLVHKWLTAGVVEQGKKAEVQVGTPQGAVISPLLANIYLHYVFDLWAQRWRRREAAGDVIVVRYADDSVSGFQSKADVKRFLAEVRVRFAKFGLTLNDEKTRVLEFGRFAAENSAKRGRRKPETFDFLGFTHICGTKRANGRFIVKRSTTSKRMRATLTALRQTLHRRRHEPIHVVGQWLRRVVQGYFNYHAVPGNSDRLSAFRRDVARAWLHALRRRGQHGKMQWKRFRQYVARYLPLVRVLHPYPAERFDARFAS